MTRIQKTKRKRTPYRVGYEHEKLVKKKLEAVGFFVMDARSSRGIVDMIAVRWSWDFGHEVWLVQAKKAGYIGPADRAILVSVAKSVHAVPVLAEGVRPTRFWRICEGTQREALVLG